MLIPLDAAGRGLRCCPACLVGLMDTRVQNETDIVFRLAAP